VPDFGLLMNLRSSSANSIYQMGWQLKGYSERDIRSQVHALCSSNACWQYPGTVTADDPSFFRDAMGISSV